MEKVVFSVIKGGRSSKKTSGIGYIHDGNLYIPSISKNGNAFIRVFEDCVKYCHPILNKQHEFKGTIEEFVEIQVEKENGSGLETIEIPVTYYIWYKKII